MSDTINIIIMSPNEIVWEGSARALSSLNKEGPFDILPNHANFMTLIKDTDVTVLLLDGKNTRTFTFEQAVLFFKENTAKIYIHTPGELEGSKSDKV
jgi:F0F1-type ATP synthase epsilon subunit